MLLIDESILFNGTHNTLVVVLTHLEKRLKSFMVVVHIQREGFSKLTLISTLAVFRGDSTMEDRCLPVEGLMAR